MHNCWVINNKRWCWQCCFFLMKEYSSLTSQKNRFYFLHFLIVYGAKFVKCTRLKTFCLRFPWKSAKLLSWWTSFNSPKRTSLVRRVVSIQGLEFSTIYRARWYSINHNFYKLSKLFFLWRPWKRFSISFTLKAVILDKKNYLSFIF